MADHSVIISNTVSVFGIEPTNKWGVVLWGQKWGIGNVDLPVDVEKVIDNTLASVSQTIIESLEHIIENAVSLVSQQISESLVDSDGYYHVFVGGSTNAQNRPNTLYSQIASGSASWTSGTDPSTNWS